MRPIRNRVARIAAIAALLLTLFAASATPALGDTGTPLDTIQSPDDGGGVLLH